MPVGTNIPKNAERLYFPLILLITLNFIYKWVYMEEASAFSAYFCFDASDSWGLDSFFGQP